MEVRITRKHLASKEAMVQCDARPRTILERPTGVGKIYQGEEFVCDTRYTVTVYQTQLYTKPGDPSIEGLQDITGRVTPPGVDDPSLFIKFQNLLGEPLTLHLEDGRCLDIFLKNNDGEIAYRAGGRKGFYVSEDET